MLSNKSIVTVNSNKSTTVGGVESLIRSLQQISTDSDLVELFCKIGTKEIYREKRSVKYIDYSVKKYFFIFNKLLLKLNQIIKIKSLTQPDANTIVFFHPNDLLYTPLSTLKKSTIILVQTNRFDIYFKPLSKLVMLLISKHIDYMTVYTEKDKSVFKTMYPNLKYKTVVIPRGCRIEKSNTLRVCSKKLVTVARIDEEQKDFTAMLDIFSRLPKGYSLDIYGGGSAEEIASLQEKVRNVPGVQFKGEVSDDLPDILQQYSVFLMTSRYEGFGQTLIEARSQGLPIVAFNNFDALSFIVKHGYNGFKISNSDKQEFASKISELCDNNELYNKMSKNALLKAKDTEAAYVKQLWKDIL